jgi:hypothetical protein
MVINARYALEYGKLEDFADVALQFTLAASKTRDSAGGLLYHAWDESRSRRWADPVTGCSPHFWGRTLAVCCASRIKSQKSDRKAIFTLQTAIEPKVRAGRIIGIFALLMAQKSTSATGS